VARVLLTGAAGYIASHTWLALQAAGHEVVGTDNFSNSSPKALEALSALLGHTPSFVEADCCDQAAMTALMRQHRIEATVHFAAHKAVGESAAQPLDYYGNNLGGLVAVCKAMQAAGAWRMVFSSSATVYGMAEKLPLQEDAPLSATNPYGQTKLMAEHILADVARAEPRWQNGVLRYFNPVGAHPSGEIGEDPRGTPNNLMPYVAQVAVGRRPQLQVHGDDYPTPDGTGVRDYIHVMDLAEGHVAALNRLLCEPGSFTLNLGTGRGHSVLEVIAAYERASGRKVAYAIGPRRAGDVAASYADPALAERLLGWRATRSLDDMCADSWRWQQSHPNGFSNT
jgi:UDP-glucose 4-epimerase